MTFGDFLYDRRMHLELKLREVCSVAGLDPSNYSKYERGVWGPPGEDVLRRIATALRIEPSTPEWTQMRDLAAAGRWEIPRDIRSRDVVELLPAFFQQVREKQLLRSAVPDVQLLSSLQEAQR